MRRTRPPARVELLCVGSELLSGRLNTHQSYISKALLRNGLSLAREVSLPDEPAAIAREIKAALRRSEAVLVSGGLGPTFDDVTREAAARALGRPLRYVPAIFKAIERKFARYRLAVPEENRRQAFVLKGAKVLENRAGSAPGQLLTLGGPAGGRARTLALMPGPFSELEPMLVREVLPTLRRRHAGNIRVESRVLHLSGVAESAADEKLSGLTSRPGPGLSYTILAGSGQVDFHIYARAADRAEARRLAEEARRRALAAVGDHVWGEGEQTLESEVGKLLEARGLTLALAESCTAGMIGARLTSVPGSSAYFRGGVLAYDDSVKHRLLGVSPATLARDGAVSRRCAGEMARGVRKRVGASMGLSVTGIAGPAGGTRSKPVGLVYFGLSGPGNRAVVRKLRLAGERETIRQRATAAALHFLWRSIKIDTPS